MRAEQLLSGAHGSQHLFFRSASTRLLSRLRSVSVAYIRLDQRCSFHSSKL
jgi:hypothetical protein